MVNLIISLQEKLLSKCLQIGDDTYMDNLMRALNGVCEHCLPSVLSTTIQWYENQLILTSDETGLVFYSSLMFEGIVRIGKKYSFRSNRELFIITFQNRSCCEFPTQWRIQTLQIHLSPSFTLNLHNFLIFISDASVFSDKRVRFDKRQLAVHYLLCVVLIEILPQIHFFPEACEQSVSYIVTLAFKEVAYRDP